MVSKVDLSELLQLSVAERMQLAQDLWDSIVDQPDVWALDDQQRQVLEQRLDAYRPSPHSGCTWEEARRRIEGPR